MTATTIYILEIVMILLTVCSIPFALKSKKRIFTLIALLVPLLINTILHFYLLQQDPNQQPTFGYLALIGAVSLLLIRKKASPDASKTDEKSPQDDHNGES